MGWREEKQKASFRGVTFHVKSSDGDIGRRNVIHQYPKRDTAYGEDLGKKAREFTLTAFVLGDNYMAARDAFEAAIEAPGSGELVHPWRGRMTVSVTRCSVNESIDAEGKASWSVTFTEVDKNQQPNIRPDTYAIVDSAADAAIVSAQEDFVGDFTVDALPEFVEADAVERITGVIDQTLVIARSMLPDMSILPAFTRNASGIISKITQLLRLPTDLSSLLTGQISGIVGLGNGPMSAFKALSRMFDYGESDRTIPATTPSRIQQEANRQAVNNLIRRASVIEAARSSAGIQFETYQDAVSVRDSVIEALENESLHAPDVIYVALTDLRAAVIRDINARGANLATLVPYTPKATLPALVIAHRVYGDAKRDEELVTRNHISHPGFVTGGRVLEVLSDD
jgi:prophage DNA circulation protein